MTSASSVTELQHLRGVQPVLPHELQLRLDLHMAQEAPVPKMPGNRCQVKAGHGFGEEPHGVATHTGVQLHCEDSGWNLSAKDLHLRLGLPQGNTFWEPTLKFRLADIGTKGVSAHITMPKLMSLLHPLDLQRRDGSPLLIRRHRVPRDILVHKHGELPDHLRSHEGRRLNTGTIRDQLCKTASEPLLSVMHLPGIRICLRAMHALQSDSFQGMRKLGYSSSDNLP